MEEQKDNKDIIIELEILQNHQGKINHIIRKIKCLGIPVIKCKEVMANGFIICLENLDEINKSLITEKSICAYSIEIFNDEDCGYPEIYYKKERYIHTYIRLGETETWFYIKTVTLFGFLIDMYEKNLEPSDEYDDGEYADDIDYERINRLSTIVAKNKGFNLLKNRDQRRAFSKEILSNTNEEFGEHELYNIAANAESFYDFGVLPIAAKKMQLDDKSVVEIAKILGHTKARIEKAILIEVPDAIRKAIEKYE